MADLTKLRFKRGQIKSNLTRFKTFLNNCSDLDDKSIIQLRLRLEKVKSCLFEFDSIQSEIEYYFECKGDASLAEVEKERSEGTMFEQDYFDLIAQAKYLITEYEDILEREKHDRVSDNLSNIGSNLSAHNEPLMFKLPDIRLPIFRGSFEHWLEFRDTFKVMVHENHKLSAIQKFYYLKSILENEPFELIASIEVSSDNYAIAWSILHDRYENKRLIVHNYVKALFDFPQLNKESHNELRKLYDNFTKNLRSLKTLGLPTQEWDILLIHLLTSKFDNITRREWEAYKLINELPTMNEMSEFLKTRCEFLEKIELTRRETNEHNFIRKTNFERQNRFEKTRSLATTATPKRLACYFCKQSHTIFQCETFKNLDIATRINKVNKLKLCFNCFDPSHSTKNCQKSHCRLCSKKHNTMIHLSNGQTPNNSLSTINESRSTTNSVAPAVTLTEIAMTEPSNVATTSNNVTMVGHTIDNNSNNFTQCLLSTAVVRVFDKFGDLQYARALLDPGSQSNFITEDLLNRLNIDKFPINYSISGVGDSLSSAHYKTNLTLSSRLSAFTENISCLVVPKITQSLPVFSFSRKDITFSNDIVLADPNFNISQDIDLLLGVGLFYKILLMEQVNFPNMPTLQNTVLGWVIGGEINLTKCRKSTVSCLSVNNSELENMLCKFWEVEECNEIRSLTQNENFCENHFIENFKRDLLTGRFVVKFPFKDNVKNLGNNKGTSLNRFYSLERRLNQNKDLKKNYSEFMAEYISLGHMVKVNNFNLTSNLTDGYYLPHHAVIKETSLTSKIRVVFDASNKSNTGLSLNDVQYVGPTIQHDLWSIILRFRCYRYVLNADISKMYRQILIDPDETKYQRIFWRINIEDNVDCYELKTVTYGTTSAPFLAVRCLHQLGIENKTLFPTASRVILEDFYMDDLLTGSNSISEILDIQRDVSIILSGGGFELRKWLSNKKELLDQFSVNKGLSLSVLHLGENENNKTLGIFWNAGSDSIQYSIRPFDCNLLITKRLVLSITSQIFDPLGLLGPIVVRAKIFMQLLWQEKIGWDQGLPENLQKSWLNFCSDLHLLNTLSIPRQVVNETSVLLELHGFADSSEKAYGACVYVVCQVDNSNTYETKLLCAKSRVCPIKKITLPKLELCAAVLLSKLIKKVQQSFRININQSYYWSDSTIVLNWIKACPSRWKTFVANRVTTIQNSSDPEQWFHVNTNQNPADLLSRGGTAENLINSSLWWQGPEFLSIRNKKDFEDFTILKDVPEQRIVANLSTFEVLDFPFERFSCLSRLQRVTAYCIRFFKVFKYPDSRKSDFLTVSMLNNALDRLICISQMQSFSKEYLNLKQNKEISHNSKLLSLNPFMDQKQIIRVGGRLENADISFNKKHPIILDYKHHLTTLLMQQEHLKLMHCGPQQLLYSIREKYWPISGRRLARTIVKRCVICFRAKPIACEYLMGNLPPERVNQCVPFTNTGIDYAGPVMIKDRQLRGAKFVKAYICLFICLSTKCIHLELLTSLASDAFLAMLKRFMGRRGKPLNLFSDNGSTFVGANAELRRFFKSYSDSISAGLSSQSISWSFIPPRAPNFGGIWEANIKQVKYHLKRMLGQVNLTYEDFMTVLTQIEGILNSRPLCPLSSDASDSSPLTPAHFLMGKSITATPDPDYIEVPVNRLNKFQHMQKIIQQFWIRWSKEYIGSLQSRLKWKRNYGDLLKVGSLVIIKEDDVPVFQWRTGRIIQLHRGKDNVVRVATVKCANNTVFKRAITRLCVLPVDT